MRICPYLLIPANAVLGPSSAAFAAESYRVDIPSLPLVDALERLGAQTGVSVGGDIPAKGLHSQAVRGRMNAAQALERMLQGTGWRGVAHGPKIFRLVVASAKRPGPRPPAPAPPPDAYQNVEIVVTATKRLQPPWVTGNAVETVRFDTPLGIAAGQGAASDLAEQIPSLTSTALGPGRNKLFVRGIADSSLSGETQATLGEYFGETRTNYNAPDPGLLLYDVKQVELLKGPQGTLYGAATLGGILKIAPERPDLKAFTQTFDLSATATKAGSPGAFTGATVNLPLISGAVGVRAVGYRQLDGGYVDDDGRGRKDINRTSTTGGRADVRAALGEMTVDVLGLHQIIRSRDRQYAIVDLAAQSGASALAQPFRSSFSLLNLEVGGPVGDVDAVSTTSVQNTSLRADYDATSFVGAPATFNDDRRFSTLSHETRLSRSRPDGSGWLAGFVAFDQRQDRRRKLAGRDDPRIPGGFRDELVDAAVFGQFSKLVGAVLLTVGARVSYSTLEGEAFRQEPLLGPSKFDHFDEVRISPSAQASWAVSGNLTAGLGYHEGYRRPGIQQIRQTISVTDGDVAREVTGTQFSNYHGDTLRVVDAAFGYRSRAPKPFRLDVTFSAMHWSDVQADRIDDTGFVFPGFLRTQNSGDLLIGNLDATASWQPSPRLTFTSGASLTKARVSRYPRTVELHELPSIPGIVAYGGVNWSHALSNDWQTDIDARASYRGRSRLGPGLLHDVSQGRTVYSTVGVTIARRGYRLSATLQNVLNDDANLFAYGNPLTIGTERQVTPQRPRNLTLGIGKEF